MAATAQNGIEDILFKLGAINASMLSSLKLEAINSGKPTERIITERNLVPQDKLLEAKAQMLGFPFVHLSNKGIAPEVLNLVPEPVARRYRLIPYDKQNGRLLVAMVDPLDLQVIQFIEKKSGMPIQPSMALPDEILETINEQYSQNLTSDVTSALKEVTEIQSQAQDATEDKAEIIKEAPVSNIISQLLEYAVKARSSDIHIEPLEDKTRVRYRIDGILHEKVILPRAVHDALVSRIKILATLKIDEKRLPQDGRFTYSSNKVAYDLRISVIPTIYGEKVVLRILPKTTTPPTLVELGIRGTALKNLESQILRPHGIILVCGPTGSGKTTTLYSVLSRVSTSKVNILTIEDPVEYQILGANQVQANPAIGLTFAAALRSFLRQDPNVILVGEIRDTETAELAIQAALTGHEVFSTLHTNSAAGAIPRLLDMGIEPFLISSSVNAVEGQRILRKICPHCRVQFAPPKEIETNIRSVLGKMLSAQTPLMLYKGKGCEDCSGSGYQGRVGIYEVLVMSPAIAALTLERATAADIEAQAVKEGMITFKQDGYMKALEGITTLEEVLRVGED